MKLFLLDNYDSFTYNIVHLLGILGVEPLVKRNTDISVNLLREYGPEGIIISPGPMRPENHPLIFDIIENFHKSVPMLGICLGMQAMNMFFGGGLAPALPPVHGKTSLIHHSGKGIFKNVPQGFLAARYHSLVVSDIPGMLRLTARTPGGTPMAFEHSGRPLFGVQFHPESYLSLCGKEILSNFLGMT